MAVGLRAVRKACDERHRGYAGSKSSAAGWTSVPEGHQLDWAARGRRLIAELRAVLAELTP